MRMEARRAGVAFGQKFRFRRIHDGESAELWSVWCSRTSARGIMPPSNKPRPSEKELRLLAGWIKHDVLGNDSNDPDPGRVTIRRLNRVEYRNTIRDLMGFDFKVEEEFPPDDTGYGST